MSYTEIGWQQINQHENTTAISKMETCRENGVKQTLICPQEKSKGVEGAVFCVQTLWAFALK